MSNKKRFKKVYLEITNICNLSCAFCPGNTRPKEEMSIANFKAILSKLENFTDYLYFHLMGEPLIHHKINEMIDYASKKFKVNITTNGYLIDKVADNENIHQINISLQAITKDEQIASYLNKVLMAVDKLHQKGTIVVYRLWNEQAKQSKILEYLESYYKISLNGNNNIKERMFIDKEVPFVWPNLNNDYCEETGSCMALRTHIGVLVNGDIVPCCLDYNGQLKLGNIFEDDIETILENPTSKAMLNGFKNNKKINPLCQHCNFYDRIKVMVKK